MAENEMTKKTSIKKGLDQFKDKILDIFSVDNIDKIQTDGIKNKLKDFQASYVKSTVEEVSHVKNEVESAVYIGMLGRYSHGKSALVNALFNLDEIDKLPEGEGVVTSKVTLVNFDCEDSCAIAYEVNGDEEKQIDISVLQNSVKQNDAASLVDYYKISLPVSGNQFAEEFRRNGINLIDLPGLGGPYFKDTRKTKRYVDDLDMVILTIRIDQIKEAALHVRPQLINCSIPVIPVLTYADMARESDLYADCKGNLSDDSEGDEIIAKAKDILSEQIPEISKYLANLIAVSSPNGYNIPQLRELILSFVKEESIAIKKSRQEISPVFKRRSQSLKKAYVSLKNNLSNFESSFVNLYNGLSPDKNNFSLKLKSVFQNHEMQKLKRQFIKDCEHEIDEFCKEAKSRMSEISSQISISDVVKGVDEIKKSINANGGIGGNHSDAIKSYFSEYKNEICDYLTGYFNELSYDKKSLSDIKNDVEKILNDDYNSEWDKVFDIEDVRNDLAKEIGIYSAMTGFQILKEICTDINSLILFFAGFGLVTFSSSWFPEFVRTIGYVMMFGAVIKVFINVPNIKEKHFGNFKRKVIDSFKMSIDPNSRKELLRQECDRVINEIAKELQNGVRLDDYSKDLRSVSQMQEKVSEQIQKLTDIIDDEIRQI